MIAFFPALIGWIIFAPSFRLANKLFPEEGKYSRWWWYGVEAVCHETFYSVYDEDFDS